MQSEDDLKALAKILAFMRAVSILLMLMHLYWYCYSFFLSFGITHNVVDRILINFNQTAGLFSHLLYTKLFCLVLLSLSLWGGKGVKHEKITVSKIIGVFTVGFTLFFFNFYLLDFGYVWSAILYITSTFLGYILLLVSGAWISRLLNDNLMQDVFNFENESFMQETRLIENEYSINLPSRFYYKGKWNSGWINIVNPFPQH